MPLLRLDPHALYTTEAVSAECRKPRVAQQLKIVQVLSFLVEHR